MSKPTRPYSVRFDGRRAMGWATLVGGALLVTYWVLYFAGFLNIAHDPMIRAFESAFPVADALFCVVLFAASRALFAGRRGGAFLLAAAGAVSAYLGLLDLTFYAGQGTYSVVTVTSALELVLNLFCVGGGAAALFAAWRLSSGKQAFPNRRRPSLEGKVVLVVGAAGRTGTATSTLLAKAGATVGLADIDEAAIERRRRELSEHGYRAVTFQVDLTEAESVDEMVDGALMAFGGVDAVVNCTGLIHPHAATTLMSYFRRRGAGHLIHVATAFGRPAPLDGIARAVARALASPGPEVSVLAQDGWPARVGSLRRVVLRVGLTAGRAGAPTATPEGVR